MPRTIRFCFDFISPYAYLAWTQIHQLAARHDARIEPWPVLFAALLQHHGNIGPAEVPAKRVWVFKDTWRTAHLLGVPFEPPPAHPFSPLLALRVASLPMPDDIRQGVIGALFAATWGGGRGVDTTERVAHVLSATGLDGLRMVGRANEPEAKAALRRQTDEAIAAGVFGVPTMIDRDSGESFWGLDSFGHLERHLLGEDPLTPEALERWQTTPVGAERRR